MRTATDRSQGMALIAVLIALTLLLLLALPFAVSMSVGADVATNEVEVRQVEQASASARDLLLAETALGHQAYDATPDHDDAAEFPGSVQLPEKFAALRQDGRMLLGGEVQDLQGLGHLDGCTPLLLANLIGTTARLAVELAADADSIQIQGGENLPAEGLVWIDHELIRYGQRDGGKLGNLTRGVLRELGFLAPTDHPKVAEHALVLDYRCIAAVAWPFTGRADPSRQQRRPFAAVGELAEIGVSGLGGFTAAEIDAFDLVLTAETRAATAPVWGRPERVFYGEVPPGRTLRVKSAVHLGAGAVVRIRDLKSGAYEYNLVMSASTPPPGTPRELLLASEFWLHLLYPVAQRYNGIDTVVEPLVPAPVNVNTARVELLAALASDIRQAHDVRVHEADGQRRAAPPQPIARGMARELAEQIAGLRQADGNAGQGVFTGWQDLAERVFKPRLDAADNDALRSRLLLLYRNLLSARDSALDMGTLPITFLSGPWVRYRAAASYARNAAASAVAARHERAGIAVAMPGWPLEQSWNTQERFEECFRLDQRAPYWLTTPINTGAVPPNALGNDPSSRYFAHVVGMAFPQARLGEPRFPSRDAADSGIRPSPSVAIPGGWGVGGELRGHETFATATDPRGHDVGKGAYKVANTGPKERGPFQPSPSRTHDLTFPFSVDGGMAGRFALSFWTEPESLTGTLFDHSGGEREANRIALLVRDGRLVFEVIDEAGLDPNPGASPMGIERTAAEWSLPLAELGLPARTPLHVSAGAYGNRPGDLSVAIDGVARGKHKFVTTLTAPLPVWDPQLDPPSFPPGSNARDKSQVEVQVESTEGFPPVGVLRIGLELFEYTSIAGNSFLCVYKDSLGGRGARMAGHEFRPGIPVDANGRPTIDLARLQQQGVNLDVFPEHPVGSQVELYGYSTHPTHDVPMQPGDTRLSGEVGGFAVARGFVRNPRPISITPPRGSPIQIGTGIDVNWSGELELADPVPTDNNPPPAASDDIAKGFPTAGGYALLVQTGFQFEADVGATTTGSSVLVGGIEVIQYSARQGTKLTGVQRAARLNGKDEQINRQWYDGTAHQFICEWADFMFVPNTQPLLHYNQVPTYILWVVPISLPVQGTSILADPVDSGTVEWVQLYPKGNEDDTEWVRYDLIQQNHIVRASRITWESVRNELTRQVRLEMVRVGARGPNNGSQVSAQAVWGTVAATRGYIGYIPQLESTFPQIHAARMAMTFRGDPFTRTSSHPHTSSAVLPCHRLVMPWNNYGAMYGRLGRQDRVALVAGSQASGTQRPPVEWQTVNWAVRRHGADNLARTPPAELLGPWPFQLVAFQDRVSIPMLGPPGDNQTGDIRLLDRIVKFPSGELPAAFCNDVHLGAAVGGGEPMQGFVDEVDVVQQVAPDLILDEPLTENGRSFQVNLGAVVNAHGPVFYAGDMTTNFPAGGGLVAIDGEILAYSARADGRFTIANQGRGLLNTEARGHDRGAHVHFLTHRPAAILAGNVSATSDRVPLQALGAMPGRGGTGLLGERELLHWTWTRISGDSATLEMPRFYPPGEDGDGTAARGLFRGRYASVPVAASAGQAIIAMPFRHWDRHVPRSDDPEQSYFQCTLGEAPAYFSGLTWSEETTDPAVDVEVMVRVDGKAPWAADPANTPGLWSFTRAAGDDKPARLNWSGSQVEVRFATVYKPGCLDLEQFRLHGWKTAPRVEKVRLEYQSETRVLSEQVSQR